MTVRSPTVIVRSDRHILIPPLHIYKGRAGGRGGSGRASVGGTRRGGRHAASGTRRQRADGFIRKARQRWDEGDFLFDSSSSDDDSFFTLGTPAPRDYERGDDDDKGDGGAGGDERGDGGGGGDERGRGGDERDDRGRGGGGDDEGGDDRGAGGGGGDEGGDDRGRGGGDDRGAGGGGGDEGGDDRVEECEGDFPVRGRGLFLKRLRRGARQDSSIASRVRRRRLETLHDATATDACVAQHEQVLVSEDSMSDKSDKDFIPQTSDVRRAEHQPGFIEGPTTSATVISAQEESGAVLTCPELEAPIADTAVAQESHRHLTQPTVAVDVEARGGTASDGQTIPDGEGNLLAMESALYDLPDVSTLISPTLAFVAPPPPAVSATPTVFHVGAPHAVDQGLAEQVAQNRRGGPRVVAQRSLGDSFERVDAEYAAQEGHCAQDSARDGSSFPTLSQADPHPGLPRLAQETAPDVVGADVDEDMRTDGTMRVAAQRSLARTLTTYGSVPTRSTGRDYEHRGSSTVQPVAEGAIAHVVEGEHRGHAPPHPHGADPVVHGVAASTALPTVSFYDGMTRTGRAGDEGHASACGLTDVRVGMQSIGRVDGGCHDSMRAYEERHGRPCGPRQWMSTTQGRRPRGYPGQGRRGQVSVGRRDRLPRLEEQTLCEEVREEAGKLVEAIEKRKGKGRAKERWSRIEKTGDRDEPIKVANEEDRTPLPNRRDVERDPSILDFAIELHRHLLEKKVPELRKLCNREGIEWSKRDTAIGELVKLLKEMGNLGGRRRVITSSGGKIWADKWKTVRRKVGETMILVDHVARPLRLCRKLHEEEGTYQIVRIHVLPSSIEHRKFILRDILRQPWRIRDLYKKSAREMIALYHTASLFHDKKSRNRIKTVLTAGLITQSVPDLTFGHFVAKRVRVVFRKRKTVGMIIHNHWAFAEKEVAVCTCQFFQLSRSDGHVKVRLPEVEGVPAFMRNSNNVTSGITISPHALETCIRKEIESCAGGMRIQIDQGGIERCFRRWESGGSVAMTTNAVRTVFGGLRSLVAVPIDRNPGATPILCPVLYLRACKETFNHNPGFQVVAREEDQVLRTMREDYIRNGLTKVARWQAGGRIGQTYVLPKDKDLGRWRPISPCTLDPARVAAARGGRAIRYMLFCLPKNDHFDLRATDDLGKRCEEVRSALTRRYDGAIVRSYDIKEMFFKLSHEVVMEAVEWLIKYHERRGMRGVKIGVRGKVCSMAKRAMLDAAEENEKPFFQKLYDDAVQREREAEAAARATSIAAQVALLQVPEANADRFQERLAAAVAALVQLRNLEDLESRVTALEQRNQELQAEIINLKQSQLSAPRPLNPRSVAVPVSQSNTVLMARASGIVASAGAGASSLSDSAGSSALVIVPNAGTSAQNATVLTGVQYNGPVVDKRAATLPSKYDGKADITSWISSMRSYFEVMRTPQEDRSMIMGTNTEPAVRNHIELQAVAAGYERIDLTEWLKPTLEARNDAESKGAAIHVLYTEPWEESKEVDFHAHMEHRLQLKQQCRVQGSVELTFFKLLINRRYIRVLIDSGSTTSFFSPNGIRKAGLGMKQVELQNPCQTQLGNQEVVISTHVVKGVRVTFDRDRTVTHELNFYVMDKCPFDAVIGLSWLKAHCLRTTWADNQFVPWVWAGYQDQYGFTFHNTSKGCSGYETSFLRLRMPV
ncbi:hypothetical protein CBR_g4452 [Chara braunii]|uniref:Reverse transcriptase domain-containing protein n=1 Tax=Chara braunii TaxID=69332 RepID=A0A388KHU8_CHABU|nr:hypothetical protein CBR_g4452 [Chara braunii]|eukprot:GBG69622.1 hypothetical protein CBR_g4452 [Chara braunii]